MRSINNDSRIWRKTELKFDKRVMGSDIDPLLFYERTQFGTQGLFGHQVDRAAQQVFKIKLNAKVAAGRGRAIEGDQNINIAAAWRSIPCRRSEQRQAASRQTGLAVPACSGSTI